MLIEKLWEECSDQEQAEVTEIEYKRIKLRDQFYKGEISGRKYRYNLTTLIKKLDEIEKKYEW